MKKRVIPVLGKFGISSIDLLQEIIQKIIEHNSYIVRIVPMTHGMLSLWQGDGMSRLTQTAFISANHATEVVAGFKNLAGLSLNYRWVVQSGSFDHESSPGRKVKIIVHFVPSINGMGELILGL